MRSTVTRARFSIRAAIDSEWGLPIVLTIIGLTVAVGLLLAEWLLPGLVPVSGTYWG